MRFLRTWDAALLAHARRAQILPEAHRAQIFNTKMPQSIGTFLVDGAGRGHVAAGRRRSSRSSRLTERQRREVDAEAARVGRVLRLTLYVCAVHAGPFTVFAEEAHEDSADLLFMPEATAADWATVFSHAEVRQVGAGLALVQAGEQDRALYLLTEGTVGVRLPRDEGAFKTIDAPSVLGELAFFDGRPALGDARRGHRRRGRAARRRRLRPPARARAGRSRTRCCATSPGSSRCACGWPAT